MSRRYPIRLLMHVVNSERVDRCLHRHRKPCHPSHLEAAARVARSAECTEDQRLSIRWQARDPRSQQTPLSDDRVMDTLATADYDLDAEPSQPCQKR